MALKYTFRCPSEKELAKKTPAELLQATIAVLNLLGFSFNPSIHRPEIQAFVDKYPDFVEENKQIVL